MFDRETFDMTVKLIVKQTAASIVEQAGLIGVSPRILHKEVAAAMGENAIGDGRACDWKVRVRLWDNERNDVDPEADTDPDLSADIDGTEIVHGLPAAAHFAAEVASKHHGAACAGLGSVALKRKISSLRTQLSNARRTHGWFNAEYEVVEMKFGSPYARKMLLRCDVAKVDTDAPADDRNPITRIKPINRVRLAGVRHTEGE